MRVSPIRVVCGKHYPFRIDRAMPERASPWRTVRAHITCCAPPKKALLKESGFKEFEFGRFPQKARRFDAVLLSSLENHLQGGASALTVLKELANSDALLTRRISTLEVPCALVSYRQEKREANSQSFHFALKRTLQYDELTLDDTALYGIIAAARLLGAEAIWRMLARLEPCLTFKSHARTNARTQLTHGVIDRVAFTTMMTLQIPYAMSPRASQAWSGCLAQRPAVLASIHFACGAFLVPLEVHLH